MKEYLRCIECARWTLRLQQLRDKEIEFPPHLSELSNLKYLDENW